MFQIQIARVRSVFLAVALLFLLLPQAHGADPEFVDSFALAPALTGDAGRARGSNIAATLESGEPEHGKKPGGHSMWISWTAPADGIATFFTENETFDTVLAIYAFTNALDTPLDRLQMLAHNDDNLQTFSSFVQFGARAGTRYYIAVDGFGGGTGDFRVRWSFVAASFPPPVIRRISDDEAVREGDTVILSVDLTPTPDLEFQWRFNGQSYNDEKGTTLIIPSMQATNVGFYSLRIRIRDDSKDLRFETAPIELQINSEGQTNALARDKLLDAIRTPVHSEDRPHAASVKRAALVAQDAGVVRGYNGSQIFNTAFATVDPTEPAHCGLSNLPTYWFVYQTPTNGLITFDTIGTAYPTVLAVYTYDPPINSYADLIPVNCDVNSLAPATGSRVQFNGLGGKEYAVVVGAINGGRGITRLNYLLRTLTPPTLRFQRVGQTAILSFPTEFGQNYIIESSDLTTAWSRLPQVVVGTGLLGAVTNSMDQPFRLLRVRLE